ncbi:hypothetical protein ACRAWF_17215 [Streptomyces sp. L7]
MDTIADATGYPDADCANDGTPRCAAQGTPAQGHQLRPAQEVGRRGTGRRGLQPPGGC